MPPRTSSPTPARAARASTRRTARCVISSRPPPSRPARVRSGSTWPTTGRCPGRVQPRSRGRSPDPTRNPEHLPSSPSDAAPRARRPHVNPTRPRPSGHRERAPVRVNHPRQGEQMTATAFSKATRVLVCLMAANLFARPALAADGDVGKSVADSATGTPLPGGEVRVLRGGNTVATATTDAFGRYVIHNLPAGSYSVEVRYLGYRSETRNVAIGATDALARTDFHLVPLPINLSAVE